jgi:AcrR family transcriptional regulator
LVCGQASRARAADTRQRILAAALDLFGEQGYAGTSVRDISERLGVTKAALYYHFPSKEAILDALLDPFLSELGRLVEFVHRSPPPPAQAITERMVALLAGPGGILCAFVHDPSVIHRKIGKDDLFSQYEEIVWALAGPDPSPTAVLRARCALGCVQSGVMGTVLARLRASPGAPWAAGAEVSTRFARLRPAGSTWLFEPMLAEDAQRVVVETAMAALGERG